MVPFGLYYCLFHDADSLALRLHWVEIIHRIERACVPWWRHRRWDHTAWLPIPTSVLTRRAVKDGALNLLLLQFPSL